MNDINKIKLPDDWAKDYESPITVQIKKIAEELEEQRANQITMKVSEQMGVYVDKNELTRALAYDRDQYRRGYEAGWMACSEKVPQWIPITYRPMTEAEEKELCKHFGIEEGSLKDWEKRVYDCPMPDDGQKVLLSTKWGVWLDVGDNDIDGEGFICYGLEEHGDFDNVLAWMPLPEPYKEEGAK